MWNAIEGPLLLAVVVIITAGTTAVILGHKTRTPQNALERLTACFARGEITYAEYQERRKPLLSKKGSCGTSEGS